MFLGAHSQVCQNLKVGSYYVPYLNSLQGAALSISTAMALSLGHLSCTIIFYKGGQVTYQYALHFYNYCKTALPKLRAELGHHNPEELFFILTHTLHRVSNSQCQKVRT